MVEAQVEEAQAVAVQQQQPHMVEVRRGRGREGGALVVREQVLRDPYEDVEADGVRGELEPVVDARVGREVAVRRLVHLCTFAL